MMALWKVNHPRFRVAVCASALVASLWNAPAAVKAQDLGGDGVPGDDAIQRGCPALVLVRCASPPSQPSRQAVHRKLQSHRLRQQEAAAGLDTVEVTAERAPAPESEVWAAFRQSVSNAAVPSCLEPSVNGGLLRLPYLLYQSAAGKCR